MEWFLNVAFIVHNKLGRVSLKNERKKERKKIIVSAKDIWGGYRGYSTPPYCT